MNTVQLFLVASNYGGTNALTYLFYFFLYMFYVFLTIIISIFRFMIPLLLPLSAGGSLAGIISIVIANERNDNNLKRVWKKVLIPSAIVLSLCIIVLIWLGL